MTYREKVFLVLCGIFLSSLVMANLIGITKIFSFYGIGIAVGVIPYPVTFIATDLVSELYGRKRANFLVWVGFAMSMFMLLVMTIGAYVPAYQPWVDFIAASENPNAVETFDSVYGYMIRGTFASMIAYLFAQLIDVRLFHFWKDLTKGKHLWLRNNASTMISQIVDTVAVILITFVGVMPASELIKLIVAGYLFKAVFALVDTPLIYLAVSYLRPRIAEEGEGIVH